MKNSNQGNISQGLLVFVIVLLMVSIILKHENTKCREPFTDATPAATTAVTPQTPEPTPKPPPKPPGEPNIGYRPSIASLIYAILAFIVACFVLYNRVYSDTLKGKS